MKMFWRISFYKRRIIIKSLLVYLERIEADVRSLTFIIKDPEYFNIHLVPQELSLG